MKDLLPLLVTILFISFCQVHPSPIREKSTAQGSNNPLNITAGTKSIFVSWGRPIPVVSVTWFTGPHESGLFHLDDASEALITDLTSCSNVRIIVDPQDDDTSTSYFGSTVTAESIPPRVRDLMISDTTARSLALSWERPATACEIIAYNITYSGVAKWGPREEHTGSATIGRGDADGATTITIDDLQPYTDYTVTVVASTEEGKGEQTNTTGVTRHDKPSSVRDLHLKSSSTSTITVTWSEPEKINGKLLNYTVRWMQGDDAAKVEDVLYPLHTIVGLKPCVEYTVGVAAITEAGKGTYEEGKQMTISELPSVVEPQCDVDTHNQQTTIRWKRPDSECLITGYEFSWDNYQKENIESKTGFGNGSGNVTLPWPTNGNHPICLRAMINREAGEWVCCAEQPMPSHSNILEYKVVMNIAAAVIASTLFLCQ